jgi:hypothetical protein
MTIVVIPFVIDLIPEQNTNDLVVKIKDCQDDKHYYGIFIFAAFLFSLVFMGDNGFLHNSETFSSHDRRF